MKNIRFIILIACLSILFPVVTAAEELPLLQEVQQKINAEFHRLDGALKASARKLAAFGLTGDEARSALTELCGNFDFAVDCSAVDPKGVMVTVVPADFRHFEGTDIGGQEQVRSVIRKHQPAMSAVFRAVEGFDAVDVEYPVLNSSGKYLGSVSFLFKPEKFFDQILPPVIQSFPVDIWVMEKSGRIVYDADPAQVGLNLFTSPVYQAYPGLLKLGRRMAAEPRGRGSYQYKVRDDNSVSPKKVYWKTAALYGTPWRIAGIHVEKDISKDGSKTADVVLMQRLETFARDADLIRSLSSADKMETMHLFKNFFHAAPGIYAVEWIDEKGVNRFGYPAANSLVDYDFHQKRETGDQEILDILAGQKPAGLVLPLTEGGTGRFYFLPVKDGERYLGMIYTIRLKK